MATHPSLAESVMRTLVVVLTTFVASMTDAQSAASVPPAADLIVQRIEFLDCVPRVGVTIYNQGQTPVQRAFGVRLRAEGSKRRAAEAVQVLGGLGAYSTTRLIFDLAPQDSYLAFADSNDAVRESNETNNEIGIAVRDVVRCPSVSIGSARTTEGQPLRFPVRISHAFSQPVRVSFATEEQSARGASFGLIDGAGNTTCNADYIRATGSIEFPAGTSELTQFVSISTCEDGTPEDPETFALRMTDVQNGTPSRDRSVGSGTIHDLAVKSSE